MKNRILHLSLALFLGLFLFSNQLLAQRGTTGSGKLTKETRSHQNFSAVAVATGLNLYLQQGSSYSVVVETDDNLHQFIKTKVEGKTLSMSIKGSIRNSTKMNVYVTLPQLTGLNASSGSDVYGQGTFNFDNLKIDLSSGADAELAVDGNNLKIHVSSGSDLFISGKANLAEIHASSGSDLKGKKLMVQSCEAHASSAADIWIHASQQAKMHASSGSDIHLFGNPKDLSISEDRSSDIHHNKG